MLSRDLELLREIGLARVLAKSYCPKQFGERQWPARQLLEKLLSIDRAVRIPLDFPLSHFFEPFFADGVDPRFELASHMGWRRTKFFLRAPELDPLFSRSAL